MMRKLVTIAVVSFCCFSYVNAESVTKVLQQGKDGYSGCKDSYFLYDSYEAGGTSLNHSEEKAYRIKACQS